MNRNSQLSTLTHLAALLLWLGWASVTNAQERPANTLPGSGGSGGTGGVVSNEVKTAVITTFYTNTTGHQVMGSARLGTSTAGLIQASVTNANNTLYFQYQAMVSTAGASSNTISFSVPPGGWYKFIGLTTTATDGSQALTYYATNGAVSHAASADSATSAGTATSANNIATGATLNPANAGALTNMNLETAVNANGSNILQQLRGGTWTGPGEYTWTWANDTNTPAPFAYTNIQSKGWQMLGATAAGFDNLRTNVYITNFGLGGFIYVPGGTNDTSKAAAMYLARNFSGAMERIRGVTIKSVVLTNDINTTTPVYGRYVAMCLQRTPLFGAGDRTVTISGTNFHMATSMYNYSSGDWNTNGLASNYTGESDAGRYWVNGDDGRAADGNYKYVNPGNSNVITTTFKFINEYTVKISISGNQPMHRSSTNAGWWRDLNSLFVETIPQDSVLHRAQMGIQSIALNFNDDFELPTGLTLTTNGWELPERVFTRSGLEGVPTNTFGFFRGGYTSPSYNNVWVGVRGATGSSMYDYSGILAFNAGGSDIVQFNNNANSATLGKFDNISRITSINATQLSTNASPAGAAINLLVDYSTLITNNNVSFTGVSGWDAEKWNKTSVVISNTSGSTKTIVLSAAFNGLPGGNGNTLYCTNLGRLEVWGAANIGTNFSWMSR